MRVFLNCEEVQQRPGSRSRVALPLPRLPAATVSAGRRLPGGQRPPHQRLALSAQPPAPQPATPPAPAVGVRSSNSSHAPEAERERPSGMRTCAVRYAAELLALALCLSPGGLWPQSGSSGAQAPRSSCRPHSLPGDTDPQKCCAACQQLAGTAAADGHFFCYQGAWSRRHAPSQRAHGRGWRPCCGIAPGEGGERPGCYPGCSECRTPRRGWPSCACRGEARRDSAHAVGCGRSAAKGGWAVRMRVGLPAVLRMRLTRAVCMRLHHAVLRATWGRAHGSSRSPED